MANKRKPVVFDDDNPEWTEEDFAHAKPAAEVLPAAFMEAVQKRKRGRPSGSDKERIAIRIDREVLARFKASGPGWQSRINEALRQAVKL